MRPGHRFGPYRLVHRLASGGFGKVFSAIDLRDGSDVALKAPLHADESSLRAFVHEIKLSERLTHPNVLSIKTIDLVGGLPVVAYPLGLESLEDRIERPLPQSIALEYIRQTFNGLAYIHRRGLIHCDIKPGNLILFPGDIVRITDFGLARDPEEDGLETRSGTIEYMAPEHSEGCVSTRSDVFAAGLVAYTFLTGRLPGRPFNWPFRGAGDLRARLPRVTKVLRRATELDPDERYVDGGSLARAFGRARRLDLIN